MAAPKMITEQVRRGIRIACAQQDTNIVESAEKAGVPKTTIYRFMSGRSDIYVTRLHEYCTKGLELTLGEILELGK